MPRASLWFIAALSTSRTAALVQQRNADSSALHSEVSGVGDDEKALHIGSLVEEIGPSDVASPRELIGARIAKGDLLFNGHFDVCEKSPQKTKSKQCAHENCKTGDTCKVLGRVDRSSGTMPRIGGNAPGSYCAISHKYKFIFVHVLKNAGTATKTWLEDAFGCAKESGKKCDEQELELHDCISSMTAYPDYLRWTWVRHPFDRALSIYSMAKSYDMSEDMTFEQFWLDEDRWYKTHLSPDHAKPQAHFLSDESLCLAVDWVGNLNDVDSSFTALLDILDADDLKEYLKKEPLIKPATNTFGTEEAEAEDAENGRELVKGNSQLSKTLRELYAEDFDLFHAK